MSVRRSQLKECVSEGFSRGWVTRELCTKASMDLKGSVGERQPESPPPISTRTLSRRWEREDPPEKKRAKDRDGSKVLLLTFSS